MSTLILGAAGSALGSSIGGTILGVSASSIGGFIGSSIGAVADRYITSALTPGTTTNTIGARLVEMTGMTSAEGNAISRVFGRARLSTQVIWVTQFKETETTETQTSGGKGGGGGASVSNSTTYLYSISFAVAIAEGNAKAQLGRVWLNGTETDLSSFTFRFYTGSETQDPDPLIQAIEGVDITPAYRGIAYIVFEDMPLADFGNRIPQVTVEVIVPLETDDPDDLLNIGRSFQIIPAAGEFVYGTQLYTDTAGGQAVVQNRHNNFNRPDASLAVDQLNTFMDDLDAVSIVVAWFGTDLRAGECLIIPKTENSSRVISPSDWSVAGYNRTSALDVSLLDGRPVYGGTPSDQTVLELVNYLTGLGKRVMFYPFILMDIPAGNTLPNPYSNNAATVGQPTLPWRGRITCSPAIGFTGTVDQTGAAATQINTFFTRTEGYRAMILHYANLLNGAGLDAFIIGSELVGLTSVRSDAADAFPAVTQLVTLAADVRAILGPGVKISYAADWSEYHSYRPLANPAEVRFNMDPLWSSANIDFVGIDNYLPISDWREGQTHLDYDEVNGPTSEYDLTYLKSNIEGGEYFDFFYASDADRENQVRTPIQDLALGKPFVFRQKDIRGWWANTHRNRNAAGTEAGSNTSWVAQSKPVWFTEFGTPAINRSPNQPNVFFDPKSSESSFPYNSNGQRDDYIQRQYLEAMLQYWRDNAPTSIVYADKMIKPVNMFIWTWDARPFPAYPAQVDVWSDGALWEKGHWLNGRIDGAVVKRLVSACCERVGLLPTQYDVSGLDIAGGLVRGMYVSNLTSEREFLETLARFCQFTAVESEGKIKFIGLANVKRAAVLNLDDLVLPDGQTFAVSITRKQEIDLPNRAELTFIDEVEDFNQASVSAQKGTGGSKDVISFSLPIVSTVPYMTALAMSYLFQKWQTRESGTLVLPPSYAFVEAGDAVSIPVGTTRRINGRILQIDITTDNAVEFESFDTSLFTPISTGADSRFPRANTVYQSARLAFMDIPLVSDTETFPHAPRIASFARPWPGTVNLYRDDGAGGFTLIQQITTRATMGETLTALFPGPVGIWDDANTVDVVLYQDGFTSQTKEQLLASNGNALAIYNAADNLWEVFQFTTATLVSPNTYRLSGLLRGQLGTEDANAGGPHPTGSQIVVLNPTTIRELRVSAEIAPLAVTYRWGPSNFPPTDPTYLTAVHAGTKRGLKPYSPTDPKLVRNSATGSLTLSWLRRTRLNGDGWEQTEVPLNEETEQYQLVILTGPAGIVKRTVVTTTPSFIYSLANQTTDFGSAQTNVYVQISQYGAAYGDYGSVLEGFVFMGSSA